MTQLTKVKQNIHEHKDKSCNRKNMKTNSRLNRAVNCFLLTVPIVEIAHCQYKTVHIIFPLNLQTITITLDVVKLRGGGLDKWKKSSKAV